MIYPHDVTTVVLATINVLASMIVFGIISYKLLTRIDCFTCIERIGMGLTAAGGLMTIGTMTYNGSPFDDWASILMRVGMAVYFIGRMTRHRFNNFLARREAQDYQDRKSGGRYR